MKKTIFKIVLNLILILCFAYFVYDSIIYIQWFIETDKIAKQLEFPTIFSHFKYETIHLCFSIIATILHLIILILINVKGVSYLCGSAVKDYRERKEARKQKKIEELEKQLNELKKDE